MKKRSTIKVSHIYWGIFILYCFFTFYTIETYQLPWGDEHFFVDISLNYNKTGEFITSVPSIYSPGVSREVNAYGPLYFWSNAKLFSFFGLHIWTGRILNIFFGLFNILLFILMIKKMNIEGKYILLFLLFVITDANYNYMMHSGRMDLCAIGFLNLAIYIFFFHKKNSFIKYLIIGITIGIGALFTPRLFLLLPLLIFYPFFEKTTILKKKTFINLVFVFIGLISVYSLWIHHAYGGYDGFINYYIFNKESDILSNNTALQDYMLNGGLFNKLFRNSYVYIPRYILFYFILIYFFVSKKVKKEGIVVFTTLLSISFILLVVEHGSESYIAMIKLFMYFIIIFTLPYLYNELNNKIILKNVLTAVIGVILSIQIVFSSQKIIKIMVTYNELHNSNIEQKIKSIIPQNSNVAADFCYFYDLLRNDCNFMLDFPDIYNIKPDFVITKNLNFNDPEYVYISDLKYDKWRLRSNFSLLQKAYDFTSARNNYSTNAYIYKRKN